MKLKPALLSSKVARQQLAHRAQRHAYVRAFTAIDQLGGLHDALQRLHATPDPTLTKEARAMRYRKQFDTAMASSKSAAFAAVEALTQHEAEIKRDAEIKAGLHAAIPEAQLQEVRAALRALPESERDRVVREAARNCDVAVIRAIRDASTPLLTGKLSVPVEELVAVAVVAANPGIEEELSDIHTALQLVDGAVSSFVKEAEALRDPVLETRAAEQQKAIAEAEEAIKAGGATFAPTDPTNED